MCATSPQAAFCPLTSEDAQNPSCDGHLGLGLLGGRADLDALHPEQRHDHGGESEQQTDDHQRTARLHVNCREGNGSTNTSHCRFVLHRVDFSCYGNGK